MAGLSYILDTNTVAELFDPDSAVRRRMRHALEDDDAIYLCQPVHYEVVRGLFKVKAARKLTDYRNRLVPMLNWMPLIDADWEQAAHHWADATRSARACCWGASSPRCGRPGSTRSGRCAMSDTILTAQGLT